ncbi:PEP-CTERM sorting domain-containing protein [Aeoliella sp.]|uniref:PEP-CTERM sorting domain-containing protein n=1 Tax=Aeoliella sp. TaxID=2795800 RepID=UPI003CCBD077
MSWTKITCFFAFCALLAAPVMADPSLSVEVATGSAAAVGPNGGFQWVIGINPDETLFFDVADDNPDQGVGGSTAIDVGFELTAGAGAVGSTLDGTNTEYENVGNSVFGDEAAGWDGVEIGTVDTNIAVAVGSTFFTGSNASDLSVVYDLATIETGPINTANLTTSISWGGMYDANGDDGGTTHGGIAQYDQSNPLDGQYGTQGSATYTALAGDANLDGTVDLLDLDLLGASWSATGGFWAEANFNNQSDDVTDLLDLDILGANWGVSSGAIGAVNVPEPSTVASLVLLLGAAGAIRFRRS